MKILLHALLVSVLFVRVGWCQDSDVPLPVPVSPPPLDEIDPVETQDDGAEVAAEEEEEGPALPAASGAAVATAPDQPSDVSASATSPTATPATPTDPYDLMLKDGTILKQYQVQQWTKTQLTIFHSTGAAKVWAHQLPENFVNAYKMDPIASAQEERSQRTEQVAVATARLQAQDERRAMRKMPVVVIEGKVEQVADEGVVLQVPEPADIANQGYQRIGGMIYDKKGKPVPKYRGHLFGSVWVTGHPLQGVVVDGDQLRFQGRVSGRHQVEQKTYPSVRFEKEAP